MIVRMFTELEGKKRSRTSGVKTRVINLKGCKTNGEVIFAIGQVIRSPKSTPIYNDSVLAGLMDVMFDYFCDNMDVKKSIIVIGIAKIAKRDALFACEIVLSFQQAFFMALESKSRSDGMIDASKYIEKTNIDFIWN